MRIVDLEKSSYDPETFILIETYKGVVDDLDSILLAEKSNG